MLDSSQGKMFLSAERGLTESDWFRSYATFYTDTLQHQNKAAVGPLYVLNDDTLAAGKTTDFVIAEDSLIVLLPVVGAVVYKQNHQDGGIVKAGEVIIIVAAKGDRIQLLNPFETELVNYLYINFKSNTSIVLQPETFLFDINSNKNALAPLFHIQGPNSACCIKSFIGKFKGREEATYKIAQPGNGIFVFVLQGTFEVQYRLLEARDGLALWNVAEIELESLSNDAIIWLVEMPVYVYK